MTYSRKAYQLFADKLLEIGVSPLVVSVGELVKLVTEAESSQVFTLSTNNLVAGADGELIKINTKTGYVEVYNAIQDGHFTVKLFDLETGRFEGEHGVDTNWGKSTELYGYDKYNELLEKERNDFSSCFREFAMKADNLAIRNRELSNMLARDKIKSLRVKEGVLEVAKKYCKIYDYANRPIAEILFNIDDALKKRAKLQPFFTRELRTETDTIISRKLYLIRLNEEAEAYSRISELPMMALIEDYKSFHAKKTDRMAKRCIKISKNIRSVIDPFCRFRADVRELQICPEEIEQMREERDRALLLRRNELDKKGVWENNGC